jgi:hypothetical protein
LVRSSSVIVPSVDTLKKRKPPGADASVRSWLGVSLRMLVSYRLWSNLSPDQYSARAAASASTSARNCFGKFEGVAAFAAVIDLLRLVEVGAKIFSDFVCG